MPTPSYGTPAFIEALPTPAAAVNIASSTFASPTVITTAGNHGLQTGQAAIIDSHATNTNANGTWIVTVVDANEFKISAFADFPGTFVNGNGVGGATGTVQSLALPGTTLPEDGVDDIDATSVNISLEALHDMVQWLAYRILANLAILPGGLLSTAVGSTILFLGNFGIQGPTVVNNTTFLAGTGSRLQIGLGARWNRYVQNLTAADHTISVTDGGVVVLAKATGTHTITVNQASDTGLGNEDTIEFWMWDPPTVGNYYRIKREGSGNFIVELNATIAGNQEACMCRIHVKAGVWRLTGGMGISPGSDA